MSLSSTLACTACTFINDPHRLRCAICDSILVVPAKVVLPYPDRVPPGVRTGPGQNFSGLSRTLARGTYSLDSDSIVVADDDDVDDLMSEAPAPTPIHPHPPAVPEKRKRVGEMAMRATEKWPKTLGDLIVLAYATRSGTAGDLVAPGQSCSTSL